MSPEEKARVKIDEQLTSVGWEVVTRFEYNRKNSSAVRGSVYVRTEGKRLS